MMIGVDLRRCTDKKVEIIAYHMARQQNCDLESRTIRQQSSMDKSNDQQWLRQLASWRCEYTADNRACCGDAPGGFVKFPLVNSFRRYRLMKTVAPRLVAAHGVGSLLHEDPTEGDEEQSASMVNFARKQETKGNSQTVMD
jgi:hypothetical protein